MRCCKIFLSICSNIFCLVRFYWTALPLGFRTFQLPVETGLNTLFGNITEVRDFSESFAAALEKINCAASSEVWSSELPQAKKCRAFSKVLTTLIPLAVTISK